MTNDSNLARPSSVREYEKNALVLKLERHQKDLLQLRKKLNSYICEPRTYSLFERIESLKQGLEKLRADNDAIIANVKDRKRSAENYVERIRNQFAEFNSMQQGVEEYIRGAKNC
ncbi:hypothetical protein FK220_011655 [Flavobacteriaceae bacterium TP-CH-4]|uniref:Uncharacterized protein n=1 Tax=Pelagihabitans pacificus TaxID=2696054 RepID=A0A967EB35_9FLAO|nr:hypothetical protein [Pelagihabitans pacificus]NHF60001.1 hypothetical protein [Pelagihabitans pacificus]